MNTPDSKSPDALRDLVLKGGRPRFGGKRRLLLGAVAVVAAGLLAFELFSSSAADDAPRYRTEPARKGELVINVSATGNLHPTNQVDVGSELSGMIEAVLVDVNDRVRKGQVLARLDTLKLRDQVRQAKADLAATEAKVRQTEATVAESAASLARLKEVARLSGGKVPSKAELDGGEATARRAVADQRAAEAAVASSRALLSTYEISLSKATVHSPIDGVVLTRKVEPGQTVAAAMTAPVLFTLAEDLRRMELQVDVDEADVGKVKDGQSARFHVDAWPGKQFPAVVTRVGWGSQTKDGVVSYLTILQVANDDLLLRPGMTATAEITTAQRKDVLLVPNTALRFSPPLAAGSAEKRSLLSSLMPRPPGGNQPKTASDVATRDGSQTLWVLKNGQPVPVRVSILGTNGQVSEVHPADGDGALPAGTPVIIEALAVKK